MVKTIYVRWYLKRSENRYYVLDWDYSNPAEDTNLGGGFEEEELSEQLIKTMMEVNEENMEYLGYFKTEKELKEHIKKLAEEEKKDIKEYGNIEWKGEDFYLIWGVLGDPVICNALEALDVEYDISIENGNWLSYITGRTSDMLYTYEDIKECLMDLYGCKLDSVCEQHVEQQILSMFDSDETAFTDEAESVELEPSKIRKIMAEAERVGRIDPAYLL